MVKGRKEMSSRKFAKFGGIVTPLATPLVEEDSLDRPGFEALIEHVLGGGVHGVFLLGTNGEAPSLSYRLRNEIIDRACRQIGDRVPILVGITDTSFTESITLAKHAADAGADALVLAPPYYFPCGQEDLLGYLRRIVPALPLPVFLYNIPSCTKTVMERETVVRASEDPKIVGLKDSSGDMLYFQQLQEAFRDRPEYRLMMGPEELLTGALLVGAHGGVCGGSNLFPKLYVEIFNAVGECEFEKALRLHALVMQIRRRIYSADYASGNHLKGMKYVLSLLGICRGAMAEPFNGLSNEKMREVAEAFEDLKEECMEPGNAEALVTEPVRSMKG